MNTLKKTIFLSNKENTQNKAMAILTLESKNNNIFCTLKTFNFENSNNLILGIKSNEKILKQNILLHDNIYNFIINKDLDLDSNLGCVLLECDKQNITPLLWGNEKNINYKNQIVNNLRCSIEKIKSVETPKTKIETKSPNISTFQNRDFLSPINSQETYELHKNSCNISNYIEENYSQISLEEEILSHNEEIAQVVNMESLFEASDDEIQKEIDKRVININGAEHKFYNMIASQLDELFDKYPQEKSLENLVENSRWVKINHEEENKYYVVGIIYDNDDIKYICYGVPGSYYNEPSPELRNYSQWLPTDTMNPYENGYWVMYQDADTGENIIIN